MSNAAQGAKDAAAGKKPDPNGGSQYQAGYDKQKQQQNANKR